jgi:hypothetical protein
MDVETIVPGHGPVSGPAQVRELKAYFEYLYDEARTRHAEGMTPLQAARAISLERWADWGEGERLVVNLANIYAELSGEEPPNPLAAFEQMAALANSGAPRDSAAQHGQRSGHRTTARDMEQLLEHEWEDVPGRRDP